MAEDTSSDVPHAIDGKLGREAGRSDQGKRIVHTMDPDFFTGIGRVSAFGAKKYHMRNFLMVPGMAWGRVFDSLIGHLMAHWGGEDLDEESGQPHILMAAWNTMVLFTYWNNPVYHPGDDRPSKVEFQGRTWADWETDFNDAKLGPKKAVEETKEYISGPSRIQAALDMLIYEGFDVNYIKTEGDEIVNVVLRAGAVRPKKSQDEVRDPSFMRDAVRPKPTKEYKRNDKP